MRTAAAPRLALATYAGAPRLPKEEALLVRALARHGLLGEPAVWTDTQVDWASYSACVVRSTWDYHHQRAAFLAWARRVAQVCALWNPLPVLEWNSHKSYLDTLAQAGVPTLPTVLIRRGEQRLLADVLAERSWDDFIVKPAVGADAWRVMRGSRSSIDLGQAHVNRVLLDDDIVVQPYVASLEDLGERSLVFVDGELTHAVRRPAGLASGDEEEELVELALLREDERAVASAALRAIGEPVLYARVDLVRDDQGAAQLLELELIEPSLFFSLAPHASERMARAIADRIYAQGARDKR